MQHTTVKRWGGKRGQAATGKLACRDGTERQEGQGRFTSEREGAEGDRRNPKKEKTVSRGSSSSGAATIASQWAMMAWREVKVR